MNPFAAIGYKAWLATRPKSVRLLAKEFPPGSVIQIGSDSNSKIFYVLGYTESGMIMVSTYDPATAYKNALNNTQYICAEHLRGHGCTCDDILHTTADHDTTL